MDIVLTIQITPVGGLPHFVELNNADLHNFALCKFNSELSGGQQPIDGDCELMRIEFPDFIPL